MTVGPVATAHASGWIGNENVSLSVRSNEGRTDVSGYVGRDSVSISGSERNVSGNINTLDGWTNLNLSVSRTANGSRTSGFGGRDSFSLTDTDLRNGEHRLSGSWGRTQIDLTRRDQGDRSIFSGYLHTPGALSERVNVTLSGGIPQSMEALYPVLSFLGPAMHMALAG